MAEKIPVGLLGLQKSQAQHPVMRQAFVRQGPGGFEADSLNSHELEKEKQEILLDLTQFILDLTGIVEPTPFSDGTNALISITRGKWLDALISTVSIIPYVGDISKLAKLPRYLTSIRKAIRIARVDAEWAIALKKLFSRLRELIDQLIKTFDKKVPDSLVQIKHEIDEFMPSTMDGAAPGGKVSKPNKMSPSELRGGARTQRIPKAKEAGSGGNGGGIIKKKVVNNTKPKSGPGSDTHRAERWEEYKSNPENAGWSKERWDKQYDVNMQQAKKSHEAVGAYRKRNGLSKKNGWETEKTLSVNGEKRRLDVVNKRTREAIEHKRGNQYLTKSTRSELERDAALRDKGWDVKWHFDDHASKPLTSMLNELEIPWTIGN